jgi:hypothetical protein
MLAALLATQLMTVAWFFDLHTADQTLERFGPYLNEATCEAVRARVVARAETVAVVRGRSSASPCFKVVVQENESGLN